MRIAFTKVAIAKIAHYMQFFFPSSSLAAVLGGALLMPSPVALGQQEPESSHRERFASCAQALQKAEQDLDAKIVANLNHAHYLLALSPQCAGRAEQASREFAEVKRLNQQRRSGEMPKP
jgi:hypothetical protein